MHMDVKQFHSLSTALSVASDMGFTGLQITLTDSKPSSEIYKLTGDDIAEANRLRRDSGMYLVVHGKLSYNFCRNWEWQIQSIVRELTLANKLNADVIIHQGKNVRQLNMTHKEALQTYIGNIIDIIMEMQRHSCKNKLVLENSSKQGTELGHTIDELSEIYRGIPRELRDYVYFCIDTCHAFSSGDMDARTVEGVHNYFDRFNYAIGIDKIKVIHFNDSKKPFNSNVDRHETIGQGHIPKDSLIAIVQFAQDNSIPLILETPTEKCMADLAFIHDHTKE